MLFFKFMERYQKMICKNNNRTRFLKQLDNMENLYFAYGSNLNYPQMMERCPSSDPVAIAKCIHFKFIINARGVATIIPNKDSEVYGVLWKITKGDLISLDIYEGVSYGTYFRSFIDVQVKEKNIKALVYFASNTEIGKPSDHYIETILEGIKYFSGHHTWLTEIKMVR